MDAARHHATSILALLHAHAYLLTHLNDFFVCRCWRDVPFEWRAFLLSLSADELAALPSMTHPVPGAPASLVSFISLAASLALPRMPSQEEATRLCWAAVSKSTVSLSITAPAAAEAAAASTAEELWQGMDAKKVHEVARMAPCVAASARTAGCRRVLDVGCGQGYVDRLLAAQGLDVLGVEALPHNVAAARQAAAQAAARQAAARPGQPVCTARFVAEGLRTDASAARNVAALLATAWPEMGGGGGARGGRAREGEGQQGEREKVGEAEAEAEGCAAEGGAAEGGAAEGVLVCALHACGDLTPTLTRCVAALGSCRALVAVPCCHDLGPTLRPT